MVFLANLFPIPVAIIICVSIARQVCTYVRTKNFLPGKQYYVLCGISVCLYTMDVDGPSKWLGTSNMYQSACGAMVMVDLVYIVHT